MLLQLQNLEESCVLFHLDVRESGANVRYRIREGIKGLVHKEIERKERVGERRQERQREERKEGWTEEGRRGCVGRDLVCEALCKMNSP